MFSPLDHMLAKKALRIGYDSILRNIANTFYEAQNSKLESKSEIAEWAIELHESAVTSASRQAGTTAAWPRSCLGSESLRLPWFDTISTLRSNPTKVLPILISINSRVRLSQKLKIKFFILGGFLHYIKHGFGVLSGT